MQTPRQDREANKLGRHLTSEDLAALIVDALVDAGVVKKTELEKAIAVTKEEIEVRKALGDY